MPWLPLPGTTGSGISVEDVAGTSYTVVSGDDGKIKRFTDESLVTVTLPDGLAVNTLVHLLFVGAAGGAVAGNGTSVVNGGGTVAENGEASCLVEATDTWNVQGATP